jgi:hypothetical protein
MSTRVHGVRNKGKGGLIVATEERVILARNGGTERKKEQMEQLSSPELVDIETVGKLLGVGERYVRRMVAERRVPCVKIGH